MSQDGFYCDEDFEGFLELLGVDPVPPEPCKHEPYTEWCTGAYPEETFPEYPTDVPEDGEWHLTRSGQYAKKVREDG